ncbi:uncharacterized protein LOC111113567 isoform X2 [Crassostrea virginica]
MDSISPAIKKRPNWTDIEKKILVDEVHHRESILYGRFKGGSGGKAAKEKAWAEVAEAVNASSSSGFMRTSTEAQKQYSNLKQRAKGKLSELKRPKTGGGPKPPSPSPVEQCILDNLEGRPSLEGIVGGIDTAVGKPSSTKRPRIQDLEMKNLQLENEKLQEEVSKIKMEKDLLKVKKTYYDIKLQMLINEHPEVVSQLLNGNEV